jgi:conjugative relaxase-like TrwC/TraI family protein
MLSIATLHAVDYYTDAASEAFGYYGGKDDQGEVDPPGYWTGTLARQHFGKDATVQREDFAALFFGIDPQSGRSLTKSADPVGFACWQAERIAADSARSADERRTAREQVGELRGEIKARDSKEGWRGHRAGIDLTFSAPKDFSLLVAAANPVERQRLLAAWRRSVEATLTDAEQRYAKTRQRDPAGRLTKEHIAGCAIAMFEHITARPVEGHPPDPDAHMHCVMFSPVLCHDAATRALFSNDLRLNLKVLDAEARARLAQELAGMGYAVTEDRQKNCTSFHLPGITEAERVRYSKRRGEIVAGLAAGQFQTAAVAAIGTRQGKGDWSRADALAAWQAGFATHGLTVERIKQAPPPDERPPRTNAEILANLLAMQSYFSARELRQALWEEAQFATLPAGTDLGHWIDARANQLLQSSDLLEAQLPDGSTASRLRSATGDEEPIFTTRSLLRREIALDDAVAGLGQTRRHAVGWDEAKVIVEGHEQIKTTEARAEAVAEGKPLPENFCWAYRDDQKAAIAQVLAGPDIGFIQAFAGTGKTTAAAAMIEVWRTKGMKVVALAPSNKAAGQLSDDCHLTGNDKALTVDAFLLSKARDAVNANTALFVDEASMLGFDHAEALINLARERGCKIVFQGDKEQLPSVARGRFFANCIEKRLGTEAAELTVITRQREEWARAATNAAARGDFATTMAMLDTHGLIHADGTDEAVLDRIARDHLADPRPVDQKMIVASRNADVAMLNARIRQALVEGGLISGGVPCMAGKERRQPIMIGVGDRLIFTDTLKAGRKKVAVNGAIGTVQSAEATDEGVRVRVLLDGQRDPVVFNARDFAAFQHAYAISIHKSQGATVESCRYLFSEFVSSELAYVGMSRHRDNFGLYCRADQKAGLANWMGKRIEKLDARDLVSADELNAAAARLRGQDAVRVNAARRHVLTRLSKIVRRLVKRAKTDLVERLPSIPTAALDSLRVHRQTLAGHLVRLRRLGHPAVNSAVVPSIASPEATATPNPSLIEKLHQRRKQIRQEGGTAPHIP